ncbi:hypothetical protein AVW15_09810 [Chelatococcus daeguensis]|uniref:hypothetical protein n=1 Tax=Chelatococcus daeguensis TaxID=444444 RepID=UPI0007ABBE7A|nr:hypothetical protein [Chelatococcus daeguensis]KZE27418.1 hypothetical protein AVW15_09810 [Chelatococcus daeguensis]
MPQRNLFAASVLVLSRQFPPSPGRALFLPAASPAPSCTRWCSFKGRVGISTAPSVFGTYANNCAPRDIPSPAYVPARDNPQCLIGYSGRSK